MDDILQRMLAIDSQAEQIIKDAETKADQINTDGRLQINSLNSQAQQSLQREAAALEEEKISVVQRECDEKISAAEKDFQERGRKFIDAVSARKGDLIKMLAFPA